MPTNFIISSSTLTSDQLKNRPNNINGIPTILINSQKALYAGGARNQGAGVSDCEIIIFYDIDDIPHPQKIEITKKAFSENDFDAFVHNYSRGARATGGIFGPPFKPISFTEFEHIDRTMSIYLRPPNNPCVDVHHGHIAIRRSILKLEKYDEEMRRGQDSVFASDLVRKKYSVGYSSEKLVNYQASSVSRENA
jgi:hypothetical protein